MPRHEAVAREEEGESGEVREARVGRQRQDQRGRHLHEEQDPAVPDDLAGDQRQDRLHLIRVGQDANLAGQEADAQEEAAKDDHLRDQGGSRVLPLGLLERGDPVRDRLDAGDRGPTRSERVEHDRE